MRKSWDGAQPLTHAIDAGFPGSLFHATHSASIAAPRIAGIGAPAAPR